MPLYDFHCIDCDCDYEEFAPWNKSNEYPDVVCPTCGSHKKEKLFTGVRAEAIFVNPEGTRKWNDGQMGHDYRFKHMQPKVKQERENAEKMSHMGKDVYIHHDDISSGKNFNPNNW
ncbi:MAG: zinc ribbon domain-containing protein [Proteobacteria bacterium]|jgi:putative FmdB family regulatory protein|nr:zinc ribbon domain-containing protein [Pseudomonadota bacterium]